MTLFLLSVPIHAPHRRQTHIKPKHDNDTMALLLETTLGDIVIDLDVEGSPELCKNVLKLAKARYYTSSLVYNIQANRFCQFGDPFGDGTGGACLYGLIAADGSSEKVLQSRQRFLKSDMGRPLSEDESREKGRVVLTEMNGVPNTLGSQLLITVAEGKDKGLDGFTPSAKNYSADPKGRPLFRSLGVVAEDTNNILDQLAGTYCDPDGRPYADIRIIRALVVDDPFDDPPGLSSLLEQRGIMFDENDKVTASPDYERPPEEKVEIRISADQVDPLTGEEDVAQMKEKEEQQLQRQDKSRAVVLEMLGDLPSADIQAPENVLFVCKLNPVTEDEDLELIFSRFDEKVKAEIIRDPETGSSLQYAFVEFTEKQHAVEAYFKMNNALVDDRRIKVDFSQSVAKVWNKYSQRSRHASGGRSNVGMPRNPNGDGFRPNNNNNNNGGNFRRDPPRGGRGGGGRGRGMGRNSDRNWTPHGERRPNSGGLHTRGPPRETAEEVDQFGRQRTWRQSHGHANSRFEHNGNDNDPRAGRRDGAGDNHGGRSSPSDRRQKRHRSRSRDRQTSRDRERKHGERNRPREQQRKHQNDDSHGKSEDEAEHETRRGNRYNDRKHGDDDKHGSKRDHRDRRERRRGQSDGGEDDGSRQTETSRRHERDRSRSDRNRKSRHGQRDDSEDASHSHRKRSRDDGDDSRDRKHRSRHRKESSRRSKRHDSDSEDGGGHRRGQDEDNRDGHRRRHHDDSRDRHDHSRKRHKSEKKSKRRREGRDERKRRRRSRSRSAS